MGQKRDIWGTLNFWAKKDLFGVLKKFGPKKSKFGLKKQLCGNNAIQSRLTLHVAVVQRGQEKKRAEIRDLSDSETENF